MLNLSDEWEVLKQAATAACVPVMKEYPKRKLEIQHLFAIFAHDPPPSMPSELHIRKILSDDLTSLLKIIEADETATTQSRS